MVLIMLEEVVKGVGTLILSSERQILSTHAFCGLKSMLVMSEQ